MQIFIFDLSLIEKLYWWHNFTKLYDVYFICLHINSKENSMMKKPNKNFTKLHQRILRQYEKNFVLPVNILPKILLQVNCNITYLKTFFEWKKMIFPLWNSISLIHTITDICKYARRKELRWHDMRFFFFVSFIWSTGFKNYQPIAKYAILVFSNFNWPTRSLQKKLVFL